MPRVHSQVARKDYPQQGIKKGDTYYKWSFRYGGEHKSKNPPRPSQLTQSKMSEALAAGEALEDSITGATCPQDIVDAIADAVSSIQSVAEEYRDSASNMAVQGGAVYDECEEKADGLENWANDLEGSSNNIETLDNFDVDWEDLGETAQNELLDAARDAGLENSGCPI